MKAATLTLCLGTLALNAAAQSAAAPRPPSTLPSTAPSTASTAPALPAPHDAPRAAATAPGAMPSRGFACLIDDFVAEDLAAGRLVQVLHDWTPTFPGYHLYYPSRRQPSRAMALVIEALRHRAASE